jgi:hypothetical protein
MAARLYWTLYAFSLPVLVGAGAALTMHSAGPVLSDVFILAGQLSTR